MPESPQDTFPKGYIANTETIKLIENREVQHTLLQVKSDMEAENSRLLREHEGTSPSFAVLGMVYGWTIGLNSAVIIGIISDADPATKGTMIALGASAGAEMGLAAGAVVDAFFADVEDNTRRYVNGRLKKFSDLVWSKLDKEGKQKVLSAAQKMGVK